MRVLFTLFLVVFALGVEYVVDQAYVDYLKTHVTWEVTDYEDNIFRGWTVDEVKELLIPEEIFEMEIPSEPVMVSDDYVPKEIDWSKDAASCIHEVRNQGSCGSCWAFAVAGMVSDRCCMGGKDHGWLSPQELVSCDKANDGCNGGIRDYAIDYVVNKGLVHDACFKYIAQNGVCKERGNVKEKCDDGKDWDASHVCKCDKRINCVGVQAMAKCIESGPVSTGFYVYRDFMNYKSGVYHWDKQGSALGGHAIRCHGYSTSPEPHWKCINSWGTDWGMKGYFDIGTGECGIDTRQPGYCNPK
jgi:cathepsin B